MTPPSTPCWPPSVGDWHRLTGRSIGAYLGLVPTEYSSGTSCSQGSITKTGNGHARRLLVEAAWHHRQPYRPGVDLRRRWDAASPAARARGQQANRRLHRRWESERAWWWPQRLVSDPRTPYEQSHCTADDYARSRPAIHPSRTVRPAVTNPRVSNLTPRVDNVDTLANIRFIRQRPPHVSS